MKKMNLKYTELSNLLCLTDERNFRNKNSNRKVNEEVKSSEKEGVELFG